MSDPMFDTTLDRVISDYADRGVRPVDRRAIAQALVDARSRRRFVTLPVLNNRMLILASLVLLMLSMVVVLFTRALGRKARS